MKLALSALFVVFAYLIGSISFAVVVSKLSGLADPRTYGSKNPGATNVLRTGNKKAALFTLLGDAAKGWIVVFLMQWFGPAHGFGTDVVALVALAAFVGHLWPIYTRFEGGKGVATALGILLALSPWLGLAVLGTWLLVAYVSKYSSLAAIIAALLSPIYCFLLFGTDPRTMTVFVLSVLLLWRHSSNIKNLIEGKESKIGSKKK
ncbi:MAG: glycerol-3-phosphate 1-O-acyltransferase PlsY [Oxalobacter sp.]|nr:MAG: glycerol-3-phosphate 1-O-acyltransferase PlsY [Oxalobacter sp.]